MFCGSACDGPAMPQARLWYCHHGAAIDECWCRGEDDHGRSPEHCHWDCQVWGAGRVTGFGWHLKCMLSIAGFGRASFEDANLQGFAWVIFCDADGVMFWTALGCPCNRQDGGHGHQYLARWGHSRGRSHGRWNDPWIWRLCPGRWDGGREWSSSSSGGS